MKKNKLEECVQDYIPIQKIFENGIIKLKNNKYIKIIKIDPINFYLRSDLEKQSILNSYKIFLKTCDFDIQILVQSSKQNLERNIKLIKENTIREKKEYLTNISNEYIKFINNINSIKSSSSKIFFLIIKSSEKINNLTNSEEIIFEELNEKYLKIKECLLRCGNRVSDFSDKRVIIQIFYSFYNSRKYLKSESEIQ